MSGGLLNAQVFLINDGPNQIATANITGGLAQIAGNVGVGANSNLGSALLTIDAPGTVMTANQVVIFNNGDVVHRMGDIILQGPLVVADDAGGFGQGTYDLQMGSISMLGDTTDATNSLINAGLLFSSNPLFAGFNLAFDGSRTLLRVNKIPEPSTLILLALAACGLLAVRGRSRWR